MHQNETQKHKKKIINQDKKRLFFLEFLEPLKFRMHILTVGSCLHVIWTSQKNKTKKQPTIKQTKNTVLFWLHVDLQVQDVPVRGGGGCTSLGCSTAGLIKQSWAPAGPRGHHTGPGSKLGALVWPGDVRGLYSSPPWLKIWHGGPAELIHRRKQRAAQARIPAGGPMPKLGGRRDKGWAVEMGRGVGLKLGIIVWFEGQDTWKKTHQGHD